MNGKEFLKAVDLVVKEKHIDKEIIFEAMRNALTSAYKKNAKSKNNNVKVLINENNGDIKVYSYFISSLVDICSIFSLSILV